MPQRALYPQQEGSRFTSSAQWIPKHLDSFCNDQKSVPYVASDDRRHPDSFHRGVSEIGRPSIVAWAIKTAYCPAIMKCPPEWHGVSSTEGCPISLCIPNSSPVSSMILPDDTAQYDNLYSITNPTGRSQGVPSTPPTQNTAATVP